MVIVLCTRKNKYEKILGIGGSPCKGSNPDILMKHFFKGAIIESVSTEEIP
jgi:hypothetical protein